MSEVNQLIRWPNPEEIGGVSDHQRAECAKALSGRVGILTGGPGVGKSHTLAAIVQSLLAKGIPAWKIALCSPTGKAAVRIGEMLAAKDIEAGTATTMHRLLEPGRNGHDGDGWGFKRCAEFPLDAEFIIGDECFPAGTKIDTPDGHVNIESIAPGSQILNAVGVDSVVSTCKKEIHRAAIVTLGTTQIVCSENHPLFTRRGVVIAGELEPGDSVVRTVEAVRLLRGDHPAGESVEMECPVLFASLLREMVDEVAGVPAEDIHKGERSQSRSGSQKVSGFWIGRSHSANRASPAIKSYGYSPRCSRESLQNNEGNWPQASASRREWNRFDCLAVRAAQYSGFALGVGTANCDRRETCGIPDLLQGGPREQVENDCNRVRWTETQKLKPEGARQQEGRNAGFSRVDCVEILESSDSRLDRFRDADGKLYFYDLQAASHRSYSVQGLLVHNCSMVDITLMASLFSACKPGTHVLLVGDPEQLPPVGPGRPFADMIAAGIPCGKLTEIHRFAGRIATVCHKISAGESWQPSPKLDTTAVPPENMRHYETRDSAQQDQLLQVIELLRDKRGYDPLDHIQVLLATNRFRERINKVLQDALNPNGEQVDGCKFRMGDKVICLRNQFVEIYTDGKANPPKRYTANGEIGRVVHVASDGMRVEFPDGDTIQVSRGGQADYDLAYGVTVWKAQGSQWPVAILLPEDNYGADMICDRAFWRTGISRASELTFTIGKRSVIDRQCRVASLHTRKTLLTEKIAAVMGAA